MLVGTGNKGTFNDFQMPAVNYTLPTDNSVNEGIHAVPATTTATANGLRQAGFNIYGVFMDPLLLQQLHLVMIAVLLLFLPMEQELIACSLDFSVERF